MLSRTCIFLTTGSILLALLTYGAYAQDCANDYTTYAQDFAPGTTNRWLYDNVAPGAECVTISRILTEDEKCNEYVSSIPDSEWIRYEHRRLIDTDFELLSRNNYEQYWTSATFTLDVCINACRVRTECESITWDYDFDKCKIHKFYGYDMTKDTDSYIKWYLEKPRCPEGGPPKNGSNSHYRLAMKLFASRKYDLAKEMAAKALAAGSLWKMNYWFYSITALVAGDFSPESADEARATMEKIGVGEFPDVGAYENATIEVLLNALKSSDVPLGLAAGSQQLYIDNSMTDSLAAIIAAIAYQKVGRMDEFKSLLDGVLQSDPSNIAALYLYLDQYALMDGIMNDMTVTHAENLLMADPNNPYALTLATYIYYYMNMPNEVLSLKDRTLSSLPAALSNNLITDAEDLEIRKMIYTYNHFSNLYINDLNGAQTIETMVENEANNVAYDVDTKAMFKALLYRQKANRYFQFAFTESADSLKQLPMKSVDDITQISASDSFFSIGKLSQYMNRQYVVTQQIRNGTYTNYMPLVEKWEKLRDESPSFDALYNPVVDYNLLLLKAEYALMQGDMRDEVLGSSGYLDQAYLLVDTADSTYTVMEVQEMVAYAAIKLSMVGPAPLGEISSPANKVPNNIEDLIEQIEDTWPPNTPSKLNIIASLQLAIGDVEGSEDTLDEATDRVHSASIPWLNAAKERVENYDVQVSITELEPIPIHIPTTTSFDSTDQMAFDGLDKDWEWTPDVTPMELCTAYRYRDGDIEASVWPEKEETSVRSTMSVSYFSTNSYSCKLRCLFEEKFDCKAFTFGFNRCLLHDQSYDEVAVDDRLSVEDEMYYDIPECPQQTTNAYSQLLLGGKAMSNNLAMLALDKFDAASDLDPVMSLPKTLKALLIFEQGCPNSKMEASELLQEVQQMKKTPYEMSLYNAVTKTVEGNTLDAISDYDLITDDALVSSLSTRLQGLQPSASPEIAAQYIYKISKDIPGSAQEIEKLRQISPKSVMYRLFQVFTLYLQGDWQRVIDSADSISADVTNGVYVGSNADSADQLFVMQIKHFALVQMGKYTEAKNLYMTYKGKDKLGAYTYATQLYTTMTDVVNMEAVASPDVIADGGDCSEMSGIVARAMASSWMYVDPDVDGSRKESERNRLAEYLNDIEYSMLDGFKGAWKDVSEIFYRLNDAVGAGVAAEHLAPSIVRDLGIQLIHPDELIAWSTLASSDSLGPSTFSSVEQTLNGVSTALPGRTVTLWLKYQLYTQWRNSDDTHRNESIASAKDLLDQWSEGDKGTQYDDVYEYWRYPDPSKDVQVNYKTFGESSDLPDWAIYLIIACAAAIALALIISCIVCVAVKRDNGKSDKRYSGSIYSASSTAGHSEAGMVPGHGEVMYGGHRNDGFSFH